MDYEMNTTDKIKIKRQITDEISTIKFEIAELETITRPIAPENAIGRVSRMDAINNKSINETALAQARERLYKLEIALSKIDGSDFGMCTMCLQPIAPARIVAMPECLTCIRCAAR